MTILRTAFGLTLLLGSAVVADPIQESRAISPTLRHSVTEPGVPEPIRLADWADRAGERAGDLAIVPIKWRHGSAALAVNLKALETESQQRLGAPILPDLGQIYGVGFGEGIFSGDPPSLLDWPVSVGIFDVHPFGLFAKDFDIVQLPVRSSWDLGLGDIPSISQLGDLFGPYFAEFPQAMAAVAWVTELPGGDPDPPALSATTTPTNALPRTLRPFNTFGDLEPYFLQVTGTPDLGDGIIGWQYFGNICRDCNLNFIDDTQDILADPSLDLNGNGVPDTCEVVACNADFGDFFGAPAPDFGGAKNQQGAWFPFGPIFPENQPLPLVNVGDTMCGIGIQWSFNGNTVLPDGAIDPAMGSEFFPLMADGWNLGDGAFGATDILLTGIPDGQYAVDIYAFNPAASGLLSSDISIPGHAPQKVTGPWPGGFQLGETHACFIVDVTDGTIPITMQGIGGSGYFNGIQLQPLFDCNLNASTDADEILNGTAADANENGIPDECEATVTCSQLTWVGPDGLISAPFTDFGECTVTAPAPDEGELEFVNIMLGDQWVVQNAPFFRIDRNTDDCTFSYSCPLDTTPGVQLLNVELTCQISTTPLPAPPEDRPSSVVAVTEHQATPGFVTLADGSPPTPHIPTGPESYFSTLNSTRLSIKGRADIPGMAEPRNFCAAGALARSLAWLIEKYKLPVDSSLNDPQTLLEQTAIGMGTTEQNGTAFATTEANLNSFIDSINLEDRLKVTEVNFYDDGNASVNPNLLSKAICEGKDAYFEVEWLNASNVATSAHAMIMAAVALDTNTGEAHFAMVDDGVSPGNAQGDNTPNSGFSLHKFEPHPGLPGQWRMTNAGSNNRLRRVLTICVRPQSMLSAAKDAALNTLAELFGGSLAGSGDVAVILDETARLGDVSSFLAEFIRNHYGTEPDVVADADALKTAAATLRDLAAQYEADPNGPAGQQMIDLIELTILPIIAMLEPRFDCNANGIDDGYEIEQGLLTDADADGIPDICQCPEDVEGISPGVVDVQDLLAVLTAWGNCPVPCPPNCPEDVNDDCVVDVRDLLAVLTAWGPCN